jgi:hypothetical protein
VLSVCRTEKYFDKSGHEEKPYALLAVYFSYISRFKRKLKGRDEMYIWNQKFISEHRGR